MTKHNFNLYLQSLCEGSVRFFSLLQILNLRPSCHKTHISRVVQFISDPL